MGMASNLFSVNLCGWRTWREQKWTMEKSIRHWNNLYLTLLARLQTWLLPHYDCGCMLNTKGRDNTELPVAASLPLLRAYCPPPKL